MCFDGLECSNLTDNDGDVIMGEADVPFKFKSGRCYPDCKLDTCPNYRLCKSINWRSADCCSGLCTNCDEYFGARLDTKENIRCCICLEKNKLGISSPWCVHYLCVVCFKKIYWSVPGLGEEIRPLGCFGKCPICRAHKPIPVACTKVEPHTVPLDDYVVKMW